MTAPEVLSQFGAAPGWLLILGGAFLVVMATVRSTMARAVAVAVAAPLALVAVMQLAIANPWGNRILYKLTGFEARPAGAPKPGKKFLEPRRMNLI